MVIIHYKPSIYIRYINTNIHTKRALAVIAAKKLVSNHICAFIIYIPAFYT